MTIKKITKFWAKLPLNTLKQRRQAVMVTIFILGLIGIAVSIMQYTAAHYTQQAEQASVQYDEFLQSLHKEDKNYKQMGDQILAQYPKTPYAKFVSLSLASEAVKANDLGQAQNYLTRLLKDNGPLGHIARLRLARLWVAEQKEDEALALLAVRDQGGFGMMYQDIRGDIYAQQGNLDKARQAYAKAIQETPTGITASWLTLKQSALGTGEIEIENEALKKATGEDCG